MIIRVDDGANWDDQSIAVTITNVNEAPIDQYAVPSVTNANILGYYSFTSANNLGRDDAGDNQPMTLFGSPTQTTRPGGSGAIDLSGGQYGNIASMTTGGAMTIAGWMRFDSTSVNGFERVVDLGQANSGGIGNIYIARLGTSNDLTFTIEKNGVYTHRATLTNGITNGTWMHVAATVDASGNMTLYVNGTAAATATGVAPDVGVRTNHFVGRSNFAVDGAFDGAIDDLIITNGAMSAANVSALYQQTGGFTVAENSANATFLGTVLATDPDASNTYTFSLTNSAGGRFAIDSTTGQITVANGSLLDFETTTSHSITVRVTDQGGLTYDESFTIAVTNTNDAPILTPYFPTLPLTEDSAPYSNTVAALLGTSVSDPDPGAVEGIAVTSISGSIGTLEYSLNGTNWITVGSVSSTSALLLRETDYVRFSPNGQNGGALSITYRAWDQTSGTAGSTANTTTNGGTTAFSTATDTVTVTTSSINDAPTITNGYTYSMTTVNEDTTSAGVAASTILTASSWADVDTGAVNGLAITGKTGNGTWQYSTDGTTWNAFGAVSSTSALLITSSTQVRYVPDGNNGETATFTYKAWDQTSGTASTNGTANYATTASSGGTTAFSSNNATASMTITSVNDAPVLGYIGTQGLPATNEDTTSSATLVSDILLTGLRTDADSSALSGIAITSVTATGTFQYSTDGVTWTNFGAVSSTNALLLTSTSRVRFVPDGNNGESASFIFRAWDQTSGTASINGAPGYANPGAGGGTTAYSSQTSTVQITVTSVNDAPTITNGATYTLTGTDENTTSSGTLASAILTGTSWADVDTSALSGLAITGKTGNGTWQYSTDGTTWNSFGPSAPPMRC